MAGPWITLPALITCPHGAPVLGLTASGAVRGRAGPAADVRAVGQISACSAKPPCSMAVWRRGFSKVASRGAALLDSQTPGECLNALGASQGPTQTAPTSPRVRGR